MILESKTEVRRQEGTCLIYQKEEGKGGMIEGMKASTRLRKHFMESNQRKAHPRPRRLHKRRCWTEGWVPLRDLPKAVCCATGNVI